MSRVRAILLNYNGAADTIECLASLAAQVDVTCAPLVVDNGSRDGSVAQIRDAWPDAEIVETGRNLGFTGGNNVAIKQALDEGWDYLFLVNNDTVMEPDCVARLVECARERPEAAVVSPAMYFYSDRAKPWFTGSGVDWEHGQTFHDVEPIPGGKSARPIDLPWTTGCAMLVPAGRMREIGGFDERFFCYWEDSDWSFRAHRAGYACVLCPAASLYHKISATAERRRGDKIYYICRNRLLCMAKNAGHGPVSGYMARLAARMTRDAIRRRIQDPTTHVPAELLGILDYHRGRFGPCRYRLDRGAASPSAAAKAPAPT